MAWITTPLQWQFGEEPTTEDDQPVAANVLLVEGEPVGAVAGSTPANCAGHLTANPAIPFLGFAARSVDNTTAGAAAPNLLNYPNTGTGLDAGAFVRLHSEGRIRLLKALVPTAAIAGLVGTQADVNKVIYYDGTVFTNTAANNVKIGTVAAVGLTNSSNVYWDVEFSCDPNRTS